jgi:hypothetical protein
MIIDAIALNPFCVGGFLCLSIILGVSNSYLLFISFKATFISSLRKGLRIVGHAPIILIFSIVGR